MFSFVVFSIRVQAAGTVLIYIYINLSLLVILSRMLAITLRVHLVHVLGKELTF